MNHFLMYPRPRHMHYDVEWVSKFSKQYETQNEKNAAVDEPNLIQSNQTNQ